MIGEIIKEQRTLKNMSRKKLAEGVCTEKYVYLIEKDERNPSAYILNHFSDKLGIDLFEYYQYLNVKNKTLFAEYKKKFERYIQLGDVKKLKKESLKASQLEDFKHEPLSYDITIINLLYEALIEGKVNETIKKLTSIFKTKDLNIDTLTLINGYIILSSCYQLENKLDEAKEVVIIAYDKISNKMGFSRYNTVIINVLISLTSFLYNDKKYKELIKHSKELIEFQEKNGQYDRIYYAYFYLAFAYYKTNELSKVKEHFMRGIHSASLFKNKMDLNFIIKMKEFSEIADKFDINKYYIEHFYKLAK